MKNFTPESVGIKPSIKDKFLIFTDMTEIEIQKYLFAWIDCPSCKGTGIIVDGECSSCKGTGKVRREQLKRNFKKTLL